MKKRPTKTEPATKKPITETPAADATPPAPATSKAASENPMTVAAFAPNLTPPLTKTEQLHAIAAAVYAQRMDEYRAHHRKGEALRDSCRDAVNRLFLARIGSATPKVNFFNRWHAKETIEVSVEVLIEAADYANEPAILAYKQWHDLPDPALPHLDAITRELRDKLRNTAGRSERVDSLVNDPEIRKRLATEGEKILNQFTPAPGAIAA